eukprot:jgi/Undpi1/10206/HiC_scaffold_28.g12659.m1
MGGASLWIGFTADTETMYRNKYDENDTSNVSRKRCQHDLLARGSHCSALIAEAASVPRKTKKAKKARNTKKARNAKKAAGKLLQEKGSGRRVPSGSAESEAGARQALVAATAAARQAAVAAAAAERQRLGGGAGESGGELEIGDGIREGGAPGGGRVGSGDGGAGSGEGGGGDDVIGGRVQKNRARLQDRQSSFPWVPMVQAILEPSTGGDNLVQEEVMQNDVDGKVAGASVENVSNMAEKEAAKRYVAL